MEGGGSAGLGWLRAVVKRGSREGQVKTLGILGQILQASSSLRPDPLPCMSDAQPSGSRCHEPCQCTDLSLLHHPVPTLLSLCFPNAICRGQKHTPNM